MFVVSVFQNKWTALHWAVDRGRNDIVYMLIEAGADPGKKNMVSRHFVVSLIFASSEEEKRKFCSPAAFLTRAMWECCSLQAFYSSTGCCFVVVDVGVWVCACL